MSHPSIRLEGKKVRLRALTRGDLETLRGFVNDPAVMRFSNVFRPIGDLQQEAWFATIENAHDSVWFGVETCSEAPEQLVGTVCLVGIDWISRAGELRIRLGTPD